MNEPQEQGCDQDVQADEIRQLRAEQVRQLYRNAPVGLVATAINSFILAFIFRNVVSPVVLLSWLAFLVVITIARVVQWYRFRQTLLHSLDTERWRRRFIWGAALSGIGWGSASFVLFPAGSIAHQTFLAFVLGGMSAGASATYAVVPAAFLAYTLPALIPIMLRFFLVGGEIHIVMGAMMLLFTVLIIIVGKHVSSVTLLSLRLVLTNSELIGNLTSSILQTEKLNKELNDHREHLEEIVEERTTELSQVNEQLLKEIDERKKAEEAVKQTAEYYQSLIENTLDIITVLDSNGTILYESPSIERLLGFTQAELVGKNVFEFVHPDDVAIARDALARFVRDPGTAQSIEVRRKHRDSSWRILEAVGNGVTGVSGEVNIVINSRDITERRRLEDHLNRAQRLDSLGVFAGGLAHDLNNIMTGVLGNIDIVLMYLKPSEKAHQRLEAAKKAAFRARELTNQLLTFAKGGEPVKKTLNLRALIEDTAGLVLRGSPVTCEMSIADDLWPVDADPGQLTQVISNLLINAAQAMPQGGTIRVCCDNVSNGPAAATGPKKEGRYVRISVEDQGIGIPKDDLDKIFDPYFTTQHTGSGLGLAIAYSIIKRHGGSITVESEPGMGTTVGVYLPASRRAIAPRAEEPGRLFMGTGRILVMDDDPVVRDVAEEVLKSLGYEVTLVQDGVEAIAVYRKARESPTPFDAVIMDLTVPQGMGGKEVMRHLLTIDPQAKVIVSSGYSDDPVMAHYQEHGFVAAVAKPYQAQELSESVHRALTISS